MTIHEIREELTRLQDPAYRELQIRIIPTVKAETILGVRTPELRRMAKQLSRTEDAGMLLADLPHAYFEENQLHAFIVSGIREYGDCIAELERFLPYVDNWATCDQMSPRIFRKHRQELRESIWRWIDSGKTYSVRFGIGMLMEHYLEEDFDPVYPEKAAAVRSKEYYINMMIAWYFATALAKQYETVLPFLEKHRLEPWTHNKTIQKACESYRITPEQKEYLRTLKIKA
ncbi:MAG: DNA alkylation repair protein [Clostridia bacterium]|nr:DNA alkylation repair protein [Clostridia bacterium]